MKLGYFPFICIIKISDLNGMNRNENIDWTERITPKKGLFEINIKELWRYRDLILLFVKRDFSSTYKQTILGPLWFLIQPLFTTVVFLILFTKIARLSTGGLPPVLFYLSGITLWNYFSDCLSKTSNVFVSNAGIFGKVYFPRMTSPVSIVISSLVKFGIQFLLFLFIYSYYVFIGSIPFQLRLELLLIPVLVLIMAIQGLGLGIIFSSLTTKYRDLTFLLQFGIQLLMYATPIVYPMASVTGKLKLILALNPLSALIENMRLIITSSAPVGYGGLTYSALFAAITLFIGVLVFNRVEKSFIDTV